MAPEVVFGYSYTFVSDFYSLGVLMYAAMTGERLTVGKNIDDAMETLVNRKISFTQILKKNSNISEIGA